MSTITPVTALYICAMAFLLASFCAIWLLSKLRSSPLSTKMIVYAGILGTFVPLTVWLIDNAPLRIQSIKYVTIMVVGFWLILGWFVSIYYDVRLRVTLGGKYYDELSRIHTRNMGRLLGYISFCLILGGITGWIVVTFGSTTTGLLLAILIGGIYGVICALLLDLIDGKKSPQSHEDTEKTG